MKGGTSCLLSGKNSSKSRQSIFPGKWGSKNTESWEQGFDGKFVEPFRTQATQNSYGSLSILDRKP